MRTRYFLLVAAMCLCHTSLAQRGRGDAPPPPTFLASVSISPSRTLVAADGDCWIRFDMTALDNHAGPYAGAALSLELSHSNGGVTVSAYDTQSSTTTSDANGNGSLWASSAAGDTSIGFRAVASGGGLTVRSSYTYVTFSAGDWVPTPDSTLAASGTWVVTSSNGGTSQSQFLVGAYELGYSGEEVDLSGAASVEVLAGVGANRTDNSQATATAQASGTAQGQVYDDVAWAPYGSQQEYSAPPGFWFYEVASAYAGAAHIGGGGATEAWSGPVGNRAYAIATGTSSDEDTVNSIAGTLSNTGGSSPVNATISFSCYVVSEATPASLSSASGGVQAIMQKTGLETFHNPILDGYPAP